LATVSEQKGGGDCARAIWNADDRQQDWEHDHPRHPAHQQDDQRLEHGEGDREAALSLVCTKVAAAKRLSILHYRTLPSARRMISGVIG